MKLTKKKGLVALYIGLVLSMLACAYAPQKIKNKTSIIWQKKTIAAFKDEFSQKMECYTSLKINPDSTVHFNFIKNIDILSIFEIVRPIVEKCNKEDTIMLYISRNGSGYNQNSLPHYRLLTVQNESINLYNIVLEEKKVEKVIDDSADLQIYYNEIQKCIVKKSYCENITNVFTFLDCRMNILKTRVLIGHCD